MNATQARDYLRNNMEQYVSDIETDMAKAREISDSTKMGFKTPLSAVHHLRKHQHEFNTSTSKDPIKVYLRNAPNNVSKDSNLIQIDQFPVNLFLF